MLKRRGRTGAVLLASCALALGSAACGDDDNDPATSADAATTEQQGAAAPAEDSVEAGQPVTGGKTILDIDETALAILDVAGVRVDAIGDAAASDGRFTFPITRGSVNIDPLSGTIEHAGGLRFSAGGRNLEATDFVIRLGDDVLTAEVAGRRVPLLAVDLQQFSAPTSSSMVLPGTAAALSKDAVSALEDRLGVELPDASVSLGRIEVSAES